VLHEGAGLRETFADLWAQPIMAEPKALEITIDHPLQPNSVGRFKEPAA
jgi:glycerol-3-phosphate dehydrogenase (NAD(P)+)